jgi:putative Mg2+ transporter-C (MgtC) family protein
MDTRAQLELVGKLLLAAFCGGFIGWQRDRHRNAAGLRTMALVAAGALMFTAINETYGQDRVTSNIVTGIGFLGGGIILRESGNVRGITTAATVWAVAAIGVAIGVELYLLALVATVLIFIILEMRPVTEYLSGRRTEMPLPPGLRRNALDHEHDAEDASSEGDEPT